MLEFVIELKIACFFNSKFWRRIVFGDEREHKILFGSLISFTWIENEKSEFSAHRFFEFLKKLHIKVYRIVLPCISTFRVMKRLSTVSKCYKESQLSSLRHVFVASKSNSLVSNYFLFLDTNRSNRTLCLWHFAENFCGTFPFQKITAWSFNLHNHQ